MVVPRTVELRIRRKAKLRIRQKMAEPRTVAPEIVGARTARLRILPRMVGLKILRATLLRAMGLQRLVLLKLPKLLKLRLKSALKKRKRLLRYIACMRPRMLMRSLAVIHPIISLVTICLWSIKRARVRKMPRRLLMIS